MIKNSPSRVTRKKTTDYFCISEKRSQKTWRKSSNSSKERDSSRISQRDNPREGEKKKENKEKQTTHEIRFWSQASRKICRSRSRNLESIGGAQSKDTTNTRSDLCFSKSAPLTSGRSPLNPRKEKPARFFFFSIIRARVQIGCNVITSGDSAFIISCLLSIFSDEEFYVYLFLFLSSVL